MSRGDRVGTLTRAVTPAVISFDFGALLRIGELAIRWETLALAAVIVVSIALTGLIAGRMPAVNEASPELGGSERGVWHLRRDDLLLILLGVIPGAVIGGRIGYVVVHWDYYSVNPGYIVDPGQGSLELSFAIIFGTAAGILVAMALGAPVGRWLHVVTIPLLLGLALGKFAMVLGANGQGSPSDLPWATRYLGEGPWGTLTPQVPAHPAQVYEGLLILSVFLLIGSLLLVGRFRDQDGRVFFAALSLWALARIAAAFLWRDPEVLGPFRAGQITALLIAAASFGLFVLLATHTGRDSREVLAERSRIGRPAPADVRQVTPPVVTPSELVIPRAAAPGIAAAGSPTTESGLRETLLTAQRSGRGWAGGDFPNLSGRAPVPKGAAIAAFVSSTTTSLPEGDVDAEELTAAEAFADRVALGPDVAPAEPVVAEPVPAAAEPVPAHLTPPELEEIIAAAALAEPERVARDAANREAEPPIPT